MSITIKNPCPKNKTRLRVFLYLIIIRLIIQIKYQLLGEVQIR